MSEYVQTYRVVTFVPEEHAREFIDAVTPHIPHLFGAYDSVTWWSEPKTEHGTEQYRARAEGEAIKQVPSVRIEFSIPKEHSVRDRFVEDVITAHHPWEAPVILIYDAEILKK